jgi:hypothetical protein
MIFDGFRTRALEPRERSRLRVPKVSRATEICPPAASRPAHRWPRVLPGGGHETARALFWCVTVVASGTREGDEMTIQDGLLTLFVRRPVGAETCRWVSQ